MKKSLSLRSNVPAASILAKGSESHLWHTLVTHPYLRPLQAATIALPAKDFERSSSLTALTRPRMANQARRPRSPPAAWSQGRGRAGRAAAHRR